MTDTKMTQDDRDRVHLFLANEDGPVLPEGLPAEASKYADPLSARGPKVGLDFGAALLRLKAGQRVARAGWNGKGMWLAYCSGYPDGVPANVSGAHAMGVPLGTPIKVLPYIAMKTADNAMVPWLASQTDMLAEDWMEVTP